CTRAYSYSIKLFAAQDSYRLDPRKASEEAGLILGDHFDEKTYMKIMADRIEKEIDGYALGNTPFGKTVNIIAGAAFGTLIDRFGLGTFANKLVGGGVQSGINGLLDLAKVDGETLAPYPALVYSVFGSKIIEAALIDQNIGPALHRYFSQKTGLDLYADMLKQPAVQIDALRDDLDMLQNGQDLDKLISRKLER